jgi:hypothetical protein
MTTFTWSEPVLDLKLNDEQLEKVITNIHWRYSAADEDGVTAETYGCQSVPAPNPEAFTAYEEVTMEIVTGWLESMMDMEAMQARLEAEIELKKNPISMTVSLYKEPVAVPEISGSVSGSL